MCGIVGVFGNESVVPELLAGLKLLEYRGYDSTGISVLSKSDFQAKLHTIRRSGRVQEIERISSEISGSVGIGHTRWATHGIPDERNAHPQTTGRIAVVHNGIVENHEYLRKHLPWVDWKSDTDTEVVLHLLESEVQKLNGDKKEALLSVARQLEGRSAFVFLFVDEPDALYAIRKGLSLLVGRKTNGELMIASDGVAFQGKCEETLLLSDQLVVRLTKDKVNAWDFQGAPVICEFQSVQLENTPQSLNGFAHFMVKEIHDQVSVTQKIIDSALHSDTGLLQDSVGVAGLNLGKINHIHLVGCGTSYHAALLGKKYLEWMTRLPVTLELGSEFQYSDQILTPKTLLIAISQSGETADTVACAEKAAASGCQIVAFCNRRNTALSALATKTIDLHCGTEVSVAATKSFTAMVLSLYFFALSCGVNRGLLKKEALKLKASESLQLPGHIRKVLELEPQIAQIAQKYSKCTSTLFIGRHWNYPVALESALKLKEVSYIHAEGLAGGELKHGTLALVDSSLPVFAIAPQDALHPKMMSNLREIKSRSGRLIGIGNSDDSEFQSLCEDYLALPVISDALKPILAAVALQLLAYHVARVRGVDIDRPRNLAKSLTVE